MAKHNNQYLKNSGVAGQCEISASMKYGVIGGRRKPMLAKHRKSKAKYRNGERRNREMQKLKQCGGWRQKSG